MQPTASYLDTDHSIHAIEWPMEIPRILPGHSRMIGLELPGESTQWSASELRESVAGVTFPVTPNPQNTSRSVLYSVSSNINTTDTSPPFARPSTSTATPFPWPTPHQVSLFPDHPTSKTISAKTTPFSGPSITTTKGETPFSRPFVLKLSPFPDLHHNPKGSNPLFKTFIKIPPTLTEDWHQVTQHAGKPLILFQCPESGWRVETVLHQGHQLPPSIRHQPWWRRPEQERMVPD